MTKLLLGFMNVLPSMPGSEANAQAVRSLPANSRWSKFTDLLSLLNMKLLRFANLTRHQNSAQDLPRQSAASCRVS